MKVIILAEHFDPLIGGATHLTKKIVAGIAQQEHEVTLIVPNSGTTQLEKDNSTYPYQLVKIGIEVEIGDRKRFVRGRRKKFALDVDAYLKALPEAERPDVLVVMTGLYLLRHVDLAYFRKQGIKVLANHLNIPPQEAGLSWEGDSFLRRFKDQFRLKLIGWINARRVAHHEADAYSVISEHTKNLLQSIIGKREVKVIPLGCEFTGFLPQEPGTGFQKPIRILTAGGINPSKNQHIIPEIAAKLVEEGIDFVWHIIGPIRNQAYADYFLAEIDRYALGERIVFVPGMPKDELMGYYEQTDIYIQTSLEEGFCMTALDAILYGLPLIGSVAGAIPAFIEEGRGILVENKAPAYVEAIRKVIAQPSDYGLGPDKIPKIVEKYSWEANAQAYIDIFEQLSASHASTSTLETAQ
ncbi:MAG: glycosyltransferase family 4 protein [Bacteroidota bacterium]